MLFLHLMNDEKFTNFSISLFEECNPNNNIFIICRYTEEQKFITPEAENIKYYLAGNVEYFNYIEECNFDVLFVHFLDYHKCITICNLKKRKKIVWLAWGADIYNSPFYKSELYQPFTRKLLMNINNRLEAKVRKLTNKILPFILIKRTSYALYKNAIKKIDYCATVIPNEYEVLQQWKFFKAKQVYFSYGSFENDLKDTNLLNSECLGSGILIGNSISPTSNHLDVFEKLKTLNFGTRKIVVPLNYGNEIKYREEIIKKGEAFFKNDWCPLLDFISKEEYIKVLVNCNVAIMNHERQQAIGNLVLLFWLGYKIFLSERSITYKYFKDKGFNIYSFQSDLNTTTINNPLSKNDFKENRQLIKEEYNHNKVIAQTMELINTVNAGISKYK